MNHITINTFEDIHHVCLMYGLKKAFGRFPFLAINIMATPPPVRRRPDRTTPLIGFRHHPVNIQYYKKDIQIIYNETKTGESEMLAFSKAVVEEYLLLRHPYMKTIWKENRLEETDSQHLIAEIITAL